MGQILVRNIDDAVKSRLRTRAKANGRSLEEEVRVILRSVVQEKAEKQEGVGTRLAKAFSGKVPKEFRIVEMRGKLRVPDFNK